MDFAYTHLITQFAADGMAVVGRFLVMLDAGMGEAGHAQTKQEREDGHDAAWFREADGSWTLDGAPVNCSVQEVFYGLAVPVLSA